MAMPNLVHLSLFCFLLHVAAADDGDDFANDLFTDLSPLCGLLALFGERVTTQFMSQSIGLADCIILAMAPLGIVTIIVSAIRVGGPALMKAIIGRARENISAAEIELMSSTSKEVCELWNGKTIVRCPGSGNILEFVCLLPGEGFYPDVKIQVKPLRGATELVNLTTSYKPNISTLKSPWQSLTSPFRSQPTRVVAAVSGADDDDDTRRWPKRWAPWSWFSNKNGSVDEEHGAAPSEARSHEQDSSQRLPSDTENEQASSPAQPSDAETEEALVQEITIIRDREADAPCISLNRHAQLERREVQAVAVFGTLLQLGVVIYFGLITYKWPSTFQKDGGSVDSYAFPLAASGTALLVMGILLCAHVVESSTDEKYWAPTSNRKAFVVWLQQNNSVSDQLFESYAIYTGREHERIVSSRRAITDEETKAFDQQTSTEKLELLDESTKARMTLEAKTVVGTGISLAGFILQFIGLRGLHWSASIAHLLSIVIMMVLRAAIRQGFAKALKTQKLMPEYELDWLAMRLSDIQTAPFFGQLEGDDTESSGGTGPRVSDETMGSTTEDTRSTAEEETEEARSSSPRESIRQETDTTVNSGLGTLPRFLQETIRGVRAVLDDIWSRRKREEEVDKVRWPDEDWIIATGYDETNYKSLIPTKPYRVTYIESSHEPLLPQVPEDTQDHRTMQLRKDLARQADWRGPASTEAVSLTLAIEEFMNFFNPPGRRTSDEFTWCVYVGKEKQVVKLTIELKNSWSISADQVEAVLSLWLYSTHSQEIDGGKKQEEESRDRKQDDGQWLRAKGPRPKAGLKLLGPDIPRLREDYNWWIPDEGSNCILAREKKDQTGSLEVDECRVDGCAKTRSRSRQVQRSKQPGKTFWNTRNAGVREYPFLKHESRGSRSKGREGLGVLTHSTLERLYAQDLFTNFVWAATEIVEWPNGSAAPRLPAAPGGLGDLEDLKLRNENLDRLVLKIRDTGLGSLSDVYASIIPPLSIRGKLPDATLPPVVREVIQHHVASGEWFQAANQCRRLVKYRHDSRAIQFAPIAIDLLHSLSFEIEFEKVGQEYGYESKWDTPDLEEMEQKLLATLLERCPPAILRGLQKLYTLKRQAARLVLPPIQIKEQDFDDSDDVFLFSFGATEVHRDNFPEGSTLDFTREDVLHARDLSGWTTLHYAAARGLESFATELLRRRVFADAVDCLGWTPLHHACYAGHFPVVKQLVRRGASIDVTGAEGWTPLHCAVFGECPAIVRLLRSENANVGVFDMRGWTVFHYAAYRGLRDVLKELGDGIPGHAQELEERAPIHLAVMAKQQGVLDLMVRDVEARDRLEQTPLHLASQQYSTILMESLLRLGASVDAQDWIDQTALHLAARQGNNDAVRLLIDAKADFNAREKGGRTPLLLAARGKGNKETAELLVNAGADINAVCQEQGRTALHYAANLEMASARLTQNHDSPLSAVSSEGDSNATEFGRFLVRKGIRVDVKDKEGHTAEDYARGSGLMNLAECLHKAMERNRDERTSHGEHGGGK